MPKTNKELADGETHFRNQWTQSNWNIGKSQDSVHYSHFSPKLLNERRAVEEREGEGEMGRNEGKKEEKGKIYISWAQNKYVGWKQPDILKEHKWWFKFMVANYKLWSELND